MLFPISVIDILPIGKGVYVWMQEHILGGDVAEIVQMMVAAHVDFVVIKIHDGKDVRTDLLPLITALRAAGIVVGGWGYVYLKWSPLAEANAAVAAIQRYQPDFYLLDAEAYAKLQFVGAKIFRDRLRSLLPDFPVGLNSYWLPSLHPELPWYTLRVGCNFDCPQVYWRNRDPVGKLFASKAYFAKMTPKLPFPMVAGDMYYEYGVKPTPQEVWDFLQAAEDDPEIKSVVMWSADQAHIVPELWATFAAFEWEHAGEMPPPPPPKDVQPLYRAVCTASPNLRIRSGPGASYATVGAVLRGDAVTVWEEKRDNLGQTWARTEEEKDDWVAAWYLKKI